VSPTGRQVRTANILLLPFSSLQEVGDDDVVVVAATALAALQDAPISEWQVVPGKRKVETGIVMGTSISRQSEDCSCCRFNQPECWQRWPKYKQK